jgi:hypothetical protein
VTPLDVKRAADLYVQGRTLRHIGVRLGVPWTAVGHQLRRAGVTMRRQHLVTDFLARQLPACVLDLVSAVGQRRLPVITVCGEPTGHAGNGQARNAEQIVGRRASRRRQDWATHAVGSHYP